MCKYKIYIIQYIEEKLFYILYNIEKEKPAHMSMGAMRPSTAGILEVCD